MVSMVILTMLEQAYIQLRAIVCVEEMLSIDLDVWNVVVARCAHPTGSQRRHSGGNKTLPHYHVGCR